MSEKRAPDPTTVERSAECIATLAISREHALAEGRILAGFRRVDDVIAGLLPAIESFEGRGRSGGNGRPADPSAGGGKV